MLAEPPFKFVQRSVLRSLRAPGLLAKDERAAASRYFRDRQSPATPLLRLGKLAAAIGISEIVVKDESRRLGLESFKILGVDYAVAALRASGRLLHCKGLVCATTGNHGRAVAAVGHSLGLPVKVYVPAQWPRTARLTSLSKQAEIVRVEGGYDDALLAADADAAAGEFLHLSDTPRTERDEVPRLVIAGYSYLFEELERQWSGSPPDLMFVQAGGGQLAFAAASWLQGHPWSEACRLVCVEPLGAACVMSAVLAGRSVRCKPSRPTAMTALNCLECSEAVWPGLAASVSGFVEIGDAWAERALYECRARDEEWPGGSFSMTGIAGVAAALALCKAASADSARHCLAITPSTRVLAINTEGAIYSDVSPETPHAAR